MIKFAAVAGLALIAATPISAVAAQEELVSTGLHSNGEFAAALAEVGLPDGRLAAALLQSGAFAKAAVTLNAVRPDAANDPARLINLGNAYAGLGRMDDARQAYRSARFAPETLLVLADGSQASSRDVARRAMGRLNPSYALR